MSKKNYPGGLKLLLLLLFGILFALSSTCFANTSQLVMTSDELDAFFDAPNRVGVCSYQGNINASSVTYFNNLLNRIGKERFLTFFNTNVLNSINANSNLLGINLTKQQLTFIFDKGIISSQDYCRIHVYISNNGIGNDFGFLKLTKRTNNYRLSAYQDIIYYCVINIDFTVSNNLSVTSTNVLNPTASGFDFYIPQVSTRSNSNLISLSGFIGYKGIQTIYYNDIPYILEDNIIQYIPEPEEPSGDDTGLGYITNPSGENGGSINLDPINQSLNNIQNQISGDTQKIIDSQNQNTQSIINNQNQNTQSTINAINNANVNYWGDNSSLSGDEQQDIISDSLNSLVANVSGELHQNAVFEHLDSAENVFLDFFRNKQDESYYDLIISWDAIAPVITMFDGSTTVSNQSIIGQDSINISELCRENSELAKIQQYIRIIFNFGCLIALLWQIYNLILSTLGIDNPFLYEDADVTDVINSDTGEVRTYYRTRKRFFKKR